MLDRRPFWGIIIWLNLCVVIWLVTVQEPLMPQTDANSQILLVEQQQIYGKHLLAAEQKATGGGNGIGGRNHQQTDYDVDLAMVGSIDPKQQQQQQQQQSDTYKYQIQQKDKDNIREDVNKTSLSARRLNRINSHINLVLLDPFLPNKNRKLPLHDVVTTTEHIILMTDHAATPVVPPSIPTPPTIAAAAAGIIRSTGTNSSISTSSSFSTADERQLIDLHNFSYIMTQPACDPIKIKVLILVHTAPRNLEKRMLIRQTWGSSEILKPRGMDDIGPLRLLFLLGAVEQNQTLQLQLEEENAIYEDMVQGSFHDDYRNMTYKHVMALKWFHYNCAQAQLLIKVDDDVFVNTPQLLKHLMTTAQESVGTNSTAAISNISPSDVTSPPVQINSTLPPPPPSLHQLLFQQRPQELLFCQQFVGARVKRSYRSKWRVSFREYAERFYPPYCPGYAIVYSADVVSRLYRAAQEATYFWIDDVMVTGVLAQRTNTTITQLKPFVLFSGDCEQLLKGATDLETKEFLFSWHSILPQQIRALWELYRAGSTTGTDGGGGDSSSSSSSSSSSTFSFNSIGSDDDIDNNGQQLKSSSGSTSRSSSHNFNR